MYKAVEANMLDFIVLGYVPGTSYQVTFNWVLGLSAVLFVVFLITKLDEHAKQKPSNSQPAINA
jgi:hypothetical protein